MTYEEAASRTGAHAFVVTPSQSIHRGRIVGMRRRGVGIVDARGVVRVASPRFAFDDAWAAFTHHRAGPA